MRIRRSTFLRALMAACVVAASATNAAEPLSVDALREQFPAASIDSMTRADAALAATVGAKTRVEKDFTAAARACLRNVLVNDCLDRARAERRRQMADVDVIELEANRFKRRAKSDRIEADRSKREAERAAHAAADAQQRERNRKAYDDRQTEAERAPADRARSGDQRARSAAAKPHQPTIRLGSPSKATDDAAQREKNAAGYASRVTAADEHQKEIDRRLVEKAADRKRRAEAKAAKDAKNAAAASAAAKAAGESPLPSIAGPKP